MSNEIEVKKLCELSKLEIPDEMILETSHKVGEVMSLFDKLDELDISSSSSMDSYGKLRIEKSLESLRDDIPRRNTSTTDSTTDSLTKFKLLNTKNGYVLGPRI
jgi:Asp-tRNA(Asn)/Glu-tRNA(Gln) amidotransferase C subunit